MSNKNLRTDLSAILQSLLKSNLHSVMNPYSHPSAPNISRQEVVDAMDAVEKYLD